MVDAVVECGSVWKILAERAATQPAPVPGNAAGTPGHGALGPVAQAVRTAARTSGIILARPGLVMCG